MEFLFEENKEILSPTDYYFLQVLADIAESLDGINDKLGMIDEELFDIRKGVEAIGE